MLGSNSLELILHSREIRLSRAMYFIHEFWIVTGMYGATKALDSTSSHWIEVG